MSTRLHQDNRRLRIPSLVPIHNVKELSDEVHEGYCVRQCLHVLSTKTTETKNSRSALTALQEVPSFSADTTTLYESLCGGVYTPLIWGCLPKFIGFL